jgi:hypothetical protein
MHACAAASQPDLKSGPDDVHRKCRLSALIEFVHEKMRQLHTHASVRRVASAIIGPGERTRACSGSVRTWRRMNMMVRSSMQHQAH